MIMVFLKTEYLSALFMLLSASGCFGAEKRKDINIMPWYFVTEIAEKHFFERIGHLPVDYEEVLIFPICKNSGFSDSKYSYLLCSPVKYRPGDPLNAIKSKFHGREVIRHLVWKRGHYLTGISNIVFYSDTIGGTKCHIVDLMPYLPMTVDKKRELVRCLVDYISNDDFQIGKPYQVEENAEPEKLISATELRSWIKRGNRKEGKIHGLWNLPIDTMVKNMLSKEDIEYIRKFLSE